MQKSAWRFASEIYGVAGNFRGIRTASIKLKGTEQMPSIIGVHKRMLSSSKVNEPIDWAKMAANYDVILPFTKLFSKQCIDVLKIPKSLHGNRVLDIAAGTGSFALEVASKIEKGDQGCIVATDLSQEMINILTFKASKELPPEKLDWLSCLQMDGQDLKLQNNSISYVGCVFGAMFFSDRVKGFSEIFRVLKPGGSAAIAVWQTMNLPLLMQQIILLEGKTTPDQLPMPFVKTIFNCKDPTSLALDVAAAGFGAQCVEVLTEERSCLLLTDDVVRVFAANPACGGLGISSDAIRQHVTNHADADGADRFVARGAVHIAVARKE